MRYNCSIASFLAYGIRFTTLACSWYQDFLEMVDDWASLVEPGNSPPLDVWPWLQYLPRCVFDWRKKPNDVRRKMEHVYSGLFSLARSRMQKDGLEACFAAQCLRSQTRYGLTDHQIIMNTSLILEAGGEIVGKTLGTMLWAMVNFLDVQKLAQEEIDSICGAQILPRYEDRAKMPYVESVIKEVLRMLPVSPLNIPHRATEDDYYRGVLIPKDSLIVANLWSFNHDSAKYADPFRFLPERHDGPSTPTAHLLHASSARRDLFNFGFGKRVCAGAGLAHAQLFVAFTRILWAFDLTSEAARGIISADSDMEGGVLRSVKPFPIGFRLRSKDRKAVINAALACL